MCLDMCFKGIAVPRFDPQVYLLKQNMTMLAHTAPELGWQTADLTANSVLPGISLAIWLRSFAAWK